MPTPDRIYVAVNGPSATAPAAIGSGRSFAEAAINALLNHHARFRAWPSRETILATLREIPGGEEAGQQAVRESWQGRG